MVTALKNICTIQNTPLILIIPNYWEKTNYNIWKLTQGNKPLNSRSEAVNVNNSYDNLINMDTSH